MRKEFRYGKRIQELREERAWTQEHLAAVAGLSPRTVQRVEKDRTQDAETIKAVAAAFDVDLERLRTTYLVPESRLMRTRLVTAVKEFVSAEHEGHHAYSRVKMVPLKDELEEQTDSLLDQVFCDRVYVEPDEPELWQSYIESVKEPLQSLFDLGLAFFLLDERRDLLLPAIPGLPKPSADHIENWRVRHYLLVARHGCFQAGCADTLHRFNDSCRSAGDSLFNAIKEEDKGLYVFGNALFAVTNAGGEDAIRWCETCFPPTPTGTRIGLEYLEQVTGMTRAQLHAIEEEIAGQSFLHGLA